MAKVDLASVASEPPPTASDEGRPFIDPPWRAPLDVERAIKAIPDDATISDMFFTFLVVGAKKQGVVLPSARDRYVQFTFYPVAEIARLLVEAAERLFPGKPPRVAFRTMGRGSPHAFLASTLGKVTLGSTEGVHPAIAALVNGYQLNVRPSALTVRASGKDWTVVRLERIGYFLDSHHVGVFEGLLKFAGGDGTVRIASRSAESADFLLTWGTHNPP